MTIPDVKKLRKSVIYRLIYNCWQHGESGRMVILPFWKKLHGDWYRVHFVNTKHWPRMTTCNKPKKINLFCRLGWHRPLYNHEYFITDTINKKTIYKVECSCGKKWLTNSRFSMLGFKIKRESQKE